MMEIFKDIPGYEGYYQASNMGRIKSLERVIVDSRNIRIFKEKILKPIIVHGYCHVTLSKNGKRKAFIVHRLVLLTFKGPSDLQTNHIDCDKKNNRIENLEYVTCLENIRHAYKNGLYKNIKKVDQYDLQGNSIKTFPSMMDAERELGIANSSISKCCLGKLKTAGNFKWRFA